MEGRTRPRAGAGRFRPLPCPREAQLAVARTPPTGLQMCGLQMRVWTEGGEREVRTLFVLLHKRRGGGDGSAAHTCKNINSADQRRESASESESQGCDIAACCVTPPPEEEGWRDVAPPLSPKPRDSELESRITLGEAGLTASPFQARRNRGAAPGPCGVKDTT